VAEGVATLPELLVVTFGRAASQELRERVRSALVEAERALADPAAAMAGDRPVLAHLANASPAEVAIRRRRLSTALADFDAATIATTHQFCQQVLTGLGVAGDSDSGVVLVENLDDLVVEVVEDLWVRKYGLPGAPEPQFTFDQAVAIGRAAVADPATQLEPQDAPVGSVAATRVRFASAVRGGLESRKRALAVLGYDDLLSRLKGVLEQPHSAALDRMREQWSVVLVDEFQDTDPVQWDVIRLAFGGAATVVLVGDPKQSIYGFRGGDIVTYLSAASTAQHQYTLDRNYRSDAPLVDALQVLFAGAALGDDRILVRPIRAAHAGSRLAGLPHPAPVRLRRVDRGWFDAASGKAPYVGDVRAVVARDLAADIDQLLRSDATFDGRPLEPNDVAVLVPQHSRASEVRAALQRRAIPAVLAVGHGSVFGTTAAADWLAVLQALDQPHRSDLVRAAALTPLVGATAEELDAGDAATDRYATQLHGWGDALRERGVAGVLELAGERGLAARVLREVGGERALTDLRHVAEALHATAVSSRFGLSAMIQWLRRRTRDASTDTATERIRRLDSDAEAVQIVTQHSSKGLQYPIVYLPFAYEAPFYNDKREVDKLFTLHDGDQRVLDVRGEETPGFTDQRTRARAEDAGERLRLLYVSLTRAESQVVLWWAPSTLTKDSALLRLLFGRDGTPTVPTVLALPPEAAVTRRFVDLAAAGISVEWASSPMPVATPSPPETDRPDLVLGRFDRSLDFRWRRTSYSALAAAADHGPSVGSEPEAADQDDEELPVQPVDVPDPALDVPSPMALMPAGTTFGTLVHAVLEHTDPGAADLATELTERAAEQVALRPGLVTAEDLAQALAAVVTTPLGPLADGRTLRDIPVSDRLAELDFELPLAGGDAPGAEDVLLGQLAPLLEAHLPGGDPLRGYADTLRSPMMAGQPLRGYLTGSLDAVFRVAGPRYLVADYKTNWLGGAQPGELSAWHYRPAALDRVMATSSYPLQALLYCVALHRFLRWRQPGYDPERHLGGVLYLYVRGMCGPATPLVDGHPCGVFAWRPPASLVAALSDLLDGRLP